MIIKDELNIQVEKFNNNKAYHENICADGFVNEMENYLDEYKQFMISAIGTDYQILKNKKGYNLKESKNSKEEVSLTHNKKKKYIIEEGTPVPFLIKLGVMGENGDVFKNSYDKFRQINKYLEFIDDTINEMLNKKLISDKIKVVDFGCGKSYLTFALHHYLKTIKKIKFEIIGLDLKKDVMDKCNKIAADFQCENLDFLTGNIKDFNKLQNVDMIFSLHACNNATDYALQKGLELGAKAILAVPCCQHEFNEKMSKNRESMFFKMDGLIGKHGILLEKYTTLATDAFRAQALELCGYKTQVMEFIDMEHTPKNTLIRGIKEKVEVSQIGKKYIEYKEFMEYLGINPLLHELLSPYYLVKE
ncbi:hypothetical protein IX317_001214 [Fusobacterium sp. DD29]|uniref:class I SAM-dependent methyltransferase n=1 Tax=unclassified Fusobacterium TaxID=2648384 RepID=UPI001D225B50|nr:MULTISPECIES: SAM-dependent methyltransferase [unclassified Fusobacterium]MBR8701353.1 hypothetical protein [Fusobacterium sp. DD45]MBR8752398.1 hypothetical protein [Fusobacterium sp. DD26]MBR8776095.1 hypothetical protein [Fusobacterium sp. DD17]MBR8804858.1 hypothetical protein [Fusobacterium sp. DD13]MBR8812032.1 hypothetical protein [Fusobacterium sp. DD14]MBR8816358.1 hypothetical protein [Fusobacterium sp. DD1]